MSAALSSIGRTASVSRERHRVRSVLVVVQVAIALVLLVSAGLMIRTVPIHTDRRAGIHTTPSISNPANICLVIARSDAERVTRLQNDIQDKLSSIPV
jgi:hypothetical protein